MLRVENNSVAGLPALRDFLDNELPPLLAELDPFTEQFTPVVQALTQYKREITGLLGNLAAASNASLPSVGGNVKVLRTSSTLNPEALAAYPAGVGRLQSNRPNPYLKPGAANQVATGLPVYENRQCSGGANATITNGGANPLTADLFDRVKNYTFANQNSTTTLPAPPCTLQGLYDAIGNGIPPLQTRYLHVWPGD